MTIGKPVNKNAKSTAKKLKVRESQVPLKTWKLKWKATFVHESGAAGRVLLKVVTPQGGALSVSMPPHDLAKPHRAAEIIVNVTGCPGDIDTLKRLVTEVARGKPKRRIKMTDRSGYHGHIFVLGCRSIPLSKNITEDEMILDPERAARSPPLAVLGLSSGTLKGWKDKVAVPVGLSSIAMAAMAAPFAAVLLVRAGLSEGFIIIVCGKSSGGKSTIMLPAMSVQGAASRKAMVPPGMTARALEETGYAFDNLMCPIDDLGRLEAKALRPICRMLTYQFCDGGGRLVADSSMKSGNSFTRFHSIGIATSERDSAEIAALAGQSRLAGEQVRMLDLRTTTEEGVFDRVPDGDGRSGKQIAEEIEQGTRDNYGHALPAFLEWLSKQDQPHFDRRLRELIDAFANDAAGGATPVHRRAAEKFALLYAALILAFDAGVIPWNKKLIRSAMMKCYRSAVSDRTYAASSASLVQRFQGLLAEPGRVLKATAAGKVTSGLEGPWLAVEGMAEKKQPILGVREQVLRSCFPNPVEYDRLIAELTVRNLMTKEDGKDRWQPRLKEGDVKRKPRLMRFSVSLLGAS